MAWIICIDYGERRTGIAISEEKTRVALPLMTIDGNEDAQFNKIKDLVVKYQAKTIVIGLPLNLSGQESDFCRNVRAFAERLKGLCENIVFWDERLTSIEAQRAIIEMGQKPSAKKSAIDMIAATLILQSYIDSFYINECF